MVTYLELTDQNLDETDSLEKAQWIHLEQPTPEEFARFSNRINIPMHIQKDVKDMYEMPHTDYFEENHVIFMDIPVILQDAPHNQTRPLCIILTKETIFTITDYPVNFIKQLDVDSIGDMGDQQDILMVILLTVLTLYIERIKKMENASNWQPEEFRSPSKKNAIFFELLDFQKSLIDFETSVEANHLTLQRLQTLFADTFDDRQKLWIDNLILESEQVATMCSVFSQVLAATATITESVVTNNLNDVMKVLTSLTIIFSVPAVVNGLFATNTTIPASINHIAFPMLISIVICTITLCILRRNKML